MADYDMALDDIIRLNRLAQQPGYGRSRSRSRSTSRSTRSRSLKREFVNESSIPRSRSRSRSVSYSRPASLDECRARRSRSRSCQSDRTISTVRSQGGWKHRGRSLTRRSHSRQSLRNGSWDRKRNHTRQFARSRSCGVSPLRGMSYRNDRVDRGSPWLLSTQHTHCECLSCKGCPLYIQNLCASYSPKYLQVGNRHQAHIWRANGNQFYPVHRNKYFEKMKALQQLRIAQQRVRHAKRLLNNKVIMYNRLQMCPREQLVYSPHVPYRQVPVLISQKQKNYRYPYYQKKGSEFDLDDNSDGELSVTIENDLARRNTDSPADSQKKNIDTVEISDDSQDLTSAEENSAGWKFNNYELSTL